MSKRNYKFRVWDINDKCFCYLDTLSFFTGESESRVCDGIPRYTGTLKGTSQYFYKQGSNTRPIYNSISEKDRYIIQQFSELLDKNNKEIYEGGIVKGYTTNNGEEVISEVLFSPLRGFYIYDIKEISDRIMYDGGIYLGQEVEVISNIFEKEF